MTFTLRPSASGDTLSSSRDPIRTNFQVIQTRWEANHGLINDATNGGKHLFLQMPDQAAAPAVAANEVGLYGAVDSGGISQLFFRGENSGSSYQLTVGTNGVDASIARFGTNTGYAANHTGGWTFLPGGLILQYGIRSSLSSGNNTVTFPRTFPTAVFSIQVTPVRDSSNVDIVYIRSAATITTSQFQMSNTASGITSAHWYAIGN